jgi:hypothetical protein
VGGGGALVGGAVVLVGGIDVLDGGTGVFVGTTNVGVSGGIAIVAVGAGGRLGTRNCVRIQPTLQSGSRTCLHTPASVIVSGPSSTMPVPSGQGLILSANDGERWMKTPSPPVLPTRRSAGVGLGATVGASVGTGVGGTAVGTSVGDGGTGLGDGTIVGVGGVDGAATQLIAASAIARTSARTNAARLTNLQTRGNRRQATGQPPACVTLS